MLTAPFLGQSFGSLQKAESYVTRYTRQQRQGQGLVGRGGAAPRRYLGCTNRRAVEPMCPYGFVLEPDETTDEWKVCQLSLQHNRACIDRQRGDTQSKGSSRSEPDQPTKSSPSVARGSAISQCVKDTSSKADEGRLFVGRGWSSHEVALAEIKQILKPTGATFWTDPRAYGSVLRCRHHRPSHVQSNAGTGCPVSITVTGSMKEDECASSWRITAMETEHNRKCRARYAAKESINSRDGGENSSVFEDADEDDSEGDSDAELTSSYGKRNRSYRSPTPPTAAFRKKRYIVLSDDDESDHEGEANTTSVGTPPTSPVPIVKQEERDHGAHRPASIPSASREPPVLSHMNTAARSSSTFLDLPDVAVEALAKEGISSMEDLRAAKIRLDDMNDVVRALEEGHGISKIRLVITRKRLETAIRQLGETA